MEVVEKRNIEFGKRSAMKSRAHSSHDWATAISNGIGKVVGIEPFGLVNGRNTGRDTGCNNGRAIYFCGPDFVCNGVVPIEMGSVKEC